MSARNFLGLGLLAAASAQTTPISTKTVDTRACTGDFAALPFCNAALPIATRVADLVNRLWQNESWIPPQLTARHGGGDSPKPLDNVTALGLVSHCTLHTLRTVQP